MGASTFMNFVPGVNARDAFSQAVDRAGYEAGHGYSGTIVEKPGFVMRHTAPLPMWEAEAFADQDTEQNDKWGPAFCVPAVAAVTTEQSDHTLEVEAADYGAAQDAAVQQLRARYPDAPGVHYVCQPNGMPVQTEAGGRLAVTATPISPEESAPRYRGVSKGYADREGGGLAWGCPVGDSPEAVEHALVKNRTADRGPFSRGVSAPEEYEIQEVRTVRRVQLARAGALPRWQVKLRLLKQEATGESGFLFYGYASS